MDGKAIQNKSNNTFDNTKIEIKDFFKSQVHAFLSISELSSHLGKDPKIVKKHILELDNEGFIRYCERFGNSDICYMNLFSSYSS